MCVTLMMSPVLKFWVFVSTVCWKIHEDSLCTVACGLASASPKFLYQTHLQGTGITTVCYMLLKKLFRTVESYQENIQDSYKFYIFGTRWNYVKKDLQKNIIVIKIHYFISQFLFEKKPVSEIKLSSANFYFDFKTILPHLSLLSQGTPPKTQTPFIFLFID